MDFRLTDDQKALKAGVRELLAGRFDRDALRASVERGTLDRGLWRELGAAGFFALRVPEGEGGVGLGLPEAVLVFEEAGRALLPGPLVATHVAAGVVEGAAEGEVVVAAADGGLVEWLDEADVVLGDAGGAVPVRSVDPLTPLHRLPAAVVAGDMSGTRPPGRRSVVPSGSAPAERMATTGVAGLLTAAEQLGSAARTTEMAVSYARTREQFGQAIGSFQAVKHLCAQMLVRTEVARAAVYAAAVTGDPVEIAGAKLLADEAAVDCARDCLQVHGGMGFTWEADVHLHLKRAWVRSRRGPSKAQAEEAEAAAL
ncbi:acyl-CoA dehydrogenase family protein [Streptomyces sp. NPDC059567]|uniref:acyl-CoA dehydrogenase family protein n=1 Tax=Streptomyces sp. NPDC059567 TaxID=3346867 RepID=UPI003697C64B